MKNYICKHYFTLILLLIINARISHQFSLRDEVGAENKFKHFSEDLPPSSSLLRLDASIQIANVTVKANGKTIYEHIGNISTKGTPTLQYHTGVHFLLLHQTTFKLISKGLYYTAQPSADKHLLRRLSNVHDGRIVILMGTSNFTFWLRSEIQDFLYDTGTMLGPELALGDLWAVIFHKGYSEWPSFEVDVNFWEETAMKSEPAIDELRRKGKIKQISNLNSTTTRMRSNKSLKEKYLKENQMNNHEIRKIGKSRILYEGLTTVKNYPLLQATPFNFTVYIEPVAEPKCAWHSDPSMMDLAKFCSLYDGYKPFCRCEKRVNMLDKFSTRMNAIFSPIPVALVTATRLNQVLRQVRQLRAGHGGREVPIIICVDGYNPEAKDLGQLLGIQVFFHKNEFIKGTRDRVNDHIRWSLKKVAEFNTTYNYTILLEDDLDLAPDLMTYFQQISWLMDVDNSILIANAYNYNSYPHTARDLRRIYLVESYPYYGWMVRRMDAIKIVNGWANDKKVADWDLFIHYNHLNNSFVVIPEVPRTKHVGGGGVHVSGYEQETTYNVRPLSKTTYVEMNMVRRWGKAYKLDLMAFIIKAQILNITENPCTVPPLSKEKPGGKFVLYINLLGDGDNHSSFYTISRCLGLYEETLFERVDGTFFRKFYYNELLMVACPVSPYCTVQGTSLVYTPTKEDIASATNNPFKKMHSEVTVFKRIPPKSVEDEIQLDNMYFYPVDINE